MASLEQFGEAELRRIQEAVQAAEERTSGEIVTYVVGECDDYPEADLVGGVLGLFAGLACAAVAHTVSGRWGFAELWGGAALWFGAFATAGFVLGYVMVRAFAGLRRRLLSRELIDRRVAVRAESAFLEEEVFETDERTGILLFLALFEHRAVVLGDRGINDKVDAGEWEAVVELMVSGMRRSDPAGALVAAVRECGAILDRHDVEIQPDDRDELPDAPRIRER